MKTTGTYMIFAAALAILQSCHSPDQKWDSKSSADTLNNMKAVVKADSSASDTANLVMSVSKLDAKFAVLAANGGLAEVELGMLAEKKGQSQAIKDFGRMMVKDHSAANKQLMALAKGKGVSLPATISSNEQKIKETLAGEPLKDFDKAYAKAMIADHKEDIQDFEDGIKQLQDPQLKAFAVNTLPVLKMHLTAIVKINSSLK